MFQIVSGAHKSTLGHTDVVSGQFQGSRMKFQVVSGQLKMFQSVSGCFRCTYEHPRSH